MTMALRQFVCGSTVMILFLCKGCHFQSSSACGVAASNTRIVGGTNADASNWPWQATISSSRLFCGGSLINNQWVMTAAHCIFPSDSYTVTLGIHTLSGSNPSKVTRKISHVVCHPHYNPLTVNNDICLLKLSHPVNYTDHIQPVCLAAADSTFHHGTRSWVTGFGFTGSLSLSDILQQVEVPIVGNSECNCYYKGINFITENMICAGFKRGGKNSCQGDSGGPLMTKNDSVWVQNGIVSFGSGCTQPEKPGVYVLVSRYQKWIRDSVDGMEPGFVTFTSSGDDSDLNFICPRTTTFTNPTPTTAGGENPIHFTYFISLCTLVLALHGLVGSGGM